MHEAAHSHVAVGNRSLFLPGGDRGAVSCSPLEGDCRLRAGKTTQPDPQGSGFFLSAASRGRNRYRRDDRASARISTRRMLRHKVALRHGSTHRPKENIAADKKYPRTQNVSVRKVPLTARVAIGGAVTAHKEQKKKPRGGIARLSDHSDDDRAEPQTQSRSFSRPLYMSATYSP